MRRGRRCRNQTCPGTVQGAAAASCGSPGLGWPCLGSACPEGDSAAAQLSHAEKLPVSSQGLEWEPNQLPKSCLGPADRSDLRVLSYRLDLQMDEGTGLSAGVVQCRRWLLPTAQLGVAIVVRDLLDVCRLSCMVWLSLQLLKASGCSYRTLITAHLEDGLEERESVGYQRATAGLELEASVV